MSCLERNEAREIAEVREANVRQYIPMVHKIAQRVSRQVASELDTDDLVSAGLVGLADAARRYDPTQVASFGTFASKRVRGAIIDEIRTAGPLSRDLIAKSDQLSKVVKKLQYQLGRQPTEDEIADRLNISLDKYFRLVEQLRNVTVLSMKELGDMASLPTGFPHRVEENPEDNTIFAELKMRLADAIRELSTREQRVLSMVYKEEISLREIGEILGVCESRVCQIKTTAVHKLRAALEEEEN